MRNPEGLCIRKQSILAAVVWRCSRCRTAQSSYGSEESNYRTEKSSFGTAESIYSTAEIRFGTAKSIHSTAERNHTA
jgi:hypothetical protein